LQKCNSNKHWCKLGTTQVVNSSLANGTTSSVVAIGATNTTTDCINQSFSQNIQIAGQNILGNGNCNKASNGLFYDNSEGGRLKWSTARNYCTNKGMRLPTLNETKAKISTGVPSSSSYYSWTSTVRAGAIYYNWFGTTIKSDDDGSYYATCVHD
jgi:hypothetical protein